MGSMEKENMNKGVNIVIFTDCASYAFARNSGAYVIATHLRSHGYSVQVVDHFLLLGLERTLAIIDKFVGSDTLFVGFSTTFMNISIQHVVHSNENEKMFRFSNYTRVPAGASTLHGYSSGVPISHDEMFAIRDRIKEKNPKTKLVMGGSKANFLSQPGIDVFILGYAENMVLDYVRFLEGKNPFLQYKIIRDECMVIDYDQTASGFDFTNNILEYHESDLIGYKEALPIEIARGCIFKCKFCAFSLTGKKKNDYIKEKELVYSTLMKNYENFGTTQYIFADDTYNESVSKLEYFLDVFRRLPFKLEFVAYLRHDLIWRFPEMADLLMESGLKSAVFGIETLNHEAGKLVGKGLHPELSTETMRWLKHDKGWNNNIFMSSGFIVGLPTETRDTVSEWAEQVLDFKYPLDAARFHVLGITPDTVRTSKSEFEINYKDYGYYFDNSKSTGWINEHWNFEEANQLAEELHVFSMGIGRQKAHGFLPMMLQNHGYSWHEIFNTGVLSYGPPLFRETVAKADMYYNKLINR